MAEAIDFSIGGDNSRFVAVMRNTQAVAARTSNRINNSLNGFNFSGAVRKIAGIATALGLIVGVAKTAQGVKDAFALGDKMSNLSAQTGMAAGKGLILQQVFRDADVEANKLGPSVNRLQKVIGLAAMGAKPAVAAFKDLGIDWKELSALAPDEEFQAVGQAIMRLQDPTDRASAAMLIFGKSGGELLKVFSDSGAVGATAGRLSSQAAILDSSAAKFGDISDRLARVPLVMQGLFLGIAEKLADPLLSILERFESTDLVAKGQEIGAWILKSAQGLLNTWTVIQQYILRFQAGFATSVGFAADIANLIYDGLYRGGELLTAAFYGAQSIATTLIASMSEGFMALVLDLQTGLQFAFQHVARFFDNLMGPIIDGISAGLEFAIQKAMEGLAQIPFLADQLGLSGYEAESFDDIQGRKKSDREKRQSQTLKSYADLRTENFNNSDMMKGGMAWVKDLKMAADELSKKAAQAVTRAIDPVSKKIFDSKAWYDTAAEFSERAMQGVQAFQLSAFKPRSATAEKPLSEWEKLQAKETDWASLQKGKFGNNTMLKSATLGGFRGTLGLGELGAVRKSGEARRAEQAARVEKSKKKTPEGTNERLDKLITVTEEAWT